MRNIGLFSATFQVSLSLADFEHLGTVLKNKGNLEIQVTVSTPVETMSTNIFEPESTMSEVAAIATAEPTPIDPGTPEAPRAAPAAPAIPPTEPAPGSSRFVV